MKITLDESWVGFKAFKKLYYLICIEYNITEREISFEQMAIFLLNQTIEDDLQEWHRSLMLEGEKYSKEQVLRVIMQANEIQSFEVN